MKKLMTEVTVVAIAFSMAAFAWADHHEGGHEDDHGVSAASKEHDVLTQDVGTWDAEIKMWMSPQGGNPMVSKAVEVNRMMEGGMWLISKMEGNFGGQEFHGMGQFGYDPVEKQYTGTWIDNMSPHMMTMEGTYDAASKTMNQVGHGYDPQSGQSVESKFETKYSDGKRIMTMYMKGGDEYWKHMEVTYTRKTS